MRVKFIDAMVILRLVVNCISMLGCLFIIISIILGIIIIKLDKSKIS